VDEEKNTVYKGIAHGACDYLVKPVCIKQLRNIWQHVVRKNLGAMNPNRSDSDDADQRMVQPVIVEGERGSAKGCAMNHNSSDSDDDHSSDSDDDDQRVVQPVIVEGERGGAKDKKFSKKKKNDGDGSDENKESMCVPSTRRKPRVTWTGELHRRFLEIVNHLGPDSKASQLSHYLYSPHQSLCFLDLFSVTIRSDIKCRSVSKDNIENDECRLPD
jgi:two-component response regulator (ARR-B family)